MGILPPSGFPPVLPLHRIPPIKPSLIKNERVSRHHLWGLQFIPYQGAIGYVYLDGPSRPCQALLPSPRGCRQPARPS